MSYVACQETEGKRYVAFMQCHLRFYFLPEWSDWGDSFSNGPNRSILADLKCRQDQELGTAFLVGYVYLGLGQHDEALDWLTTAYDRREGHCTTLKAHPHFDPLRSDPRFQDLLLRMNFPQTGRPT